MWPIVEGPQFPIFFNSAPVKVIVTITFQANSQGPTAAGGGLIFNAPPGGSATLQPTLGIFPNQTVTLSFDVAANGGFIYYGAAGAGVSPYVQFELEDILWGHG
jgi:hypothetical protein